MITSESDEHVLPFIAYMPENFLNACDTRTTFKKFKDNNSTRYHCENHTKLEKCVVTHVPPDSNLRNSMITFLKYLEWFSIILTSAFFLRLKCDDDEYFNPMTEKLQAFYENPSNREKYRMIPESLRAVRAESDKNFKRFDCAVAFLRVLFIDFQPRKMGLQVVVWMDEYQEWCRAKTVTPSANQRDFTCTLSDYGHKKNVKVKDACFLHKKFAAYPDLARNCIIGGIKTYIGDKYTKEAIKAFEEFMFGERSSGFSEDNPNPAKSMAVNFMQMRDERAKGLTIFTNSLVTLQVYSEVQINVWPWSTWSD